MCEEFVGSFQSGGSGVFWSAGGCGCCRLAVWLTQDLGSWSQQKFVFSFLADCYQSVLSVSWWYCQHQSLNGGYQPVSWPVMVCVILMFYATLLATHLLHRSNVTVETPLNLRSLHFANEVTCLSCFVCWSLCSEVVNKFGEIFLEQKALEQETVN